MTTQDEAIASIGLPWHPPIPTIVETLRSVADRLQRFGPNAVALAAVLAATGYPASTLGDGGSRGTDGTSSTERAAGVMDDKPRRQPYRNVDRNLAAALAIASAAVRDLDDLVAYIVQHAEDLDPIPVGTGECQACGRFCRPTKSRPSYRIRSGLCPSCYGAWRDAGKPDHRSDWIRARRNRLTDDQGRVHPEDDSHLDMSAETTQ